MIQHVTRDILPSELDRSTAFYALLGFDPVPAPAPLAGRAVWLEHAGTQIHLMLVDDPAAAGRRLPGHVGIVVADYDRTVERLTAAGHDVQPRREHWGSPRSYVRDPGGYLVEMMAWAPARSAGEAGE
jgi:catechol 2,3-dioxygenase-like lactoylglutathione lyase family enzyme